MATLMIYLKKSEGEEALAKILSSAIEFQPQPSNVSLVGSGDSGSDRFLKFEYEEPEGLTSFEIKRLIRRSFNEQIATFVAVTAENRISISTRHDR